MRKKRMPFRGVWIEALSVDMGREAAEDLLRRAEDHYSELCASQTITEVRALKKHLYGNIFPQMAVCSYLKKEEQDSEAVLERMKNLHFLTLEKQKSQYELLGKFPLAFALSRIMIPLIIKFSFPPTGWENEWIENSSRSITLKVHNCFYKNVLEQYGVPELISVYCDGDDYVFGGEDSPYIGWGRTITMSRGGDYCDVVYYNKDGKR